MGESKDAEYASVAVEDPGKRTANNANSSGRPGSIQAHSVKCVKRRTTLEKILIACLLITLIFVLLLIVGLIVSQRGSNVCMTRDCVAAAGSLLDNMDLDVDPCEDFYRYSCGGWTERTAIPEDKSHLSTLGQLHDRMLVLSRGLLEDRLPDNISTAEAKVKDLYESCIDEEAVETRDVEPLLRFVDDLGGWPVIDTDWDEDSWNLEETLANIRLQQDDNSLFTQKILRDIKNTTEPLIFIDQPYLLGMKSREYFLRDKEDKMVKAYMTYMESIVSELRPDIDISIIRDEMEKAFDFERDIANASSPKAQRRDLMDMYHKLTLGKIAEIAPQIDWMTYFRLVFQNETMESSEELFTFALQYIADLASIIERTPKRVIANFLMWRVTMGSVEHLSQRLRQHELEYRRVVRGEETHQARWLICVARCNKLMASALGAIFLRRHFDEQSKIDAAEIVLHIRATLMDLLRDNKWMDDETKKSALEKAESIQELIGYHPDLKKPELVDQEFEMVNISHNMLFENIIQLWKNAALKMIAWRLHFDDRESYFASPILPNAFYHNSDNKINFPAGILQPPFYSKNNLKAMNYGGIGVVIGHELTHGFDDKGRKFDRDGTLRDWFSEESNKAFNEKKQCFISQYSNFSEIINGKKVNLNGVLTQGENIADNGALKEAFLTYRSWVKERGSEEPQLPGLGLTNNQLFFLNFGQIWCSLYRPQNLNMFLTASMHPPQHLRVKGSIMNSYHFAEAYNCPVGSPMNPKEKCELW